MTTVSAQEYLLAALRGAVLSVDPWPHCYLPTALPADIALHLSRSFDRLSLESCEETAREKTYRFRTGRLDGLDVDRLPSPQWAQMVGLLTDSAYRAAMNDLTGLPLAESSLALNVWEYQTGDWLASHVDKPDKLVTQIFYLTQAWREGDGGRLLILRSGDPSDVVRSLPPALGSSAVLVRSDRSWHAVEAPGRSSGYRRSITATFWR